jgi:hypothetical protein
MVFRAYYRYPSVEADANAFTCYDVILTKMLKQQDLMRLLLRLEDAPEIEVQWIEVRRSW